MDLFEDLPEPSSNNSSKRTSSTLYDNVAAQSVTTPTDTMTTNLLYGDLPSQTITMTTEVKGKRKSTEEHKGQGEGSVKKKKTAEYRFKSYLAERQGEREDMQDAHLVIHDFTTHIPDVHPSVYRLSVYGVFDGHGGVRASRWASQHFHKNLRDKFPKGDIAQVEREIKKVLIDVFKKTDDDFLREAAKYKPVWKDGSTANIVLVINEMLFIANIGDSQAVLCRYKEDMQTYVPVSLSIAHNPSIYEERMRIQKQGGHVKDGRVMGVLEVSRSFGDGQYKKLGVTCTPDVKKCQLTQHDRYVIIACDGLWKCFEPATSIQYVNKILQNDSIKCTDTRTSEEMRFDTASNKLANEAVLRLSGDNVTVLLLSISPNS